MNAGHEDTRSRLARLKILESEKRMAEAMQFLQEMQQGGVTLQELADFVMVYLPTSNTKEVILQRLLAAREDGGDLSPEEIRFLEVTMRMQIPQKFEALDNLSALGATRLADKEAGYESWNLVNPNLLVANFGERCFGTINGIPNTGKTNLGCLIIEEWLKLGHTAIGNIGMRKEVDSAYLQISSISGLLKGAAEARLRGSKFIFIYDEAGLTHLRAEAMTKENRGQDKLARILGKLGGNWVEIEQREAGVATTIAEFSRNAYFCPSPGRITLRFEGPRVRLKKKLRDVPRTGLPYDPRDIAYLHYDVDVEQLFANLSKAEGSSRQQANRILEFLRREEAQRRPMKDACDYVCGEGMTQTEAAVLLAVYQPQVSRWLKGHECRHR